MKKIAFCLLLIALMFSISAIANAQTAIKIEIRDKAGVLVVSNYLTALSYDGKTNLMLITLRDAVPPASTVNFKLDGVVVPVTSATIEIKKK